MNQPRIEYRTNLSEQNRPDRGTESSYTYLLTSGIGMRARQTASTELIVVELISRYPDVVHNSLDDTCLREDSA
jgi:hypothetical protein